MKWQILELTTLEKDLESAANSQMYDLKAASKIRLYSWFFWKFHLALKSQSLFTQDVPFPRGSTKTIRAILHQFRVFLTPLFPGSLFWHFLLWIMIFSRIENHTLVLIESYILPVRLCESKKIPGMLKRHQQPHYALQAVVWKKLHAHAIIGTRQFRERHNC